MPAAPILAWLDMVVHPETVPHQVNDPDVIAAEPMFHVTGLVEAQPLQPVYATFTGTLS
jgi:hypothetical protein